MAQDAGTAVQLSEIGPRMVRGIRASFVSLLLFGLFFYIVSTLVLTPMRAATVRLLIEASGSPAVSNTAIASFLTTAPGMACLLVLAMTTLLLLLAQQSGLLLIAHDTLLGRRTSPLAALQQTLAALPRLLGLALVLTLLFLICALPFLFLAGLGYSVLLSDHDINYYLSVRPPQFWTAVGFGLLIAIGLALTAVFLLARTSVALPICLIEGHSWTRPVRMSWRRTRADWKKIALLVGGWLGAVAIASAILLSGLVIFGEWLLGVIPGGATTIIVATIGLVAAIDILAALGTFVSSAGLGFIMAELHLRLSHDHATADIRSAGMSVAAAPPATRRRILLRIAAVLGVFALTSIVLAYGVIESMDLKDNVQITAHRGSSAKAPENSLSAIRQAIADGADYAEIDVQETRDGTIVLLHDSDLKRVAALDKNIWEVSYDEIRDLDIGSWFSPEFSSERIATLDEAIALARGNIKLNIELKFNGHDKQLTEQVVAIISAQAFEDQSVLTSLEIAALHEAKKLGDKLQAGAIVSVSIGDITKLDVDLLSLIKGLATSEMIARARRQGLGIHVWTINDTTEMHEMIDRGVDNIITDKPELLANVLKERAGLTDMERVMLKLSHWLRGR